MSKNSLDLLVNLGVNDKKSKNNINEYISKLNNLEKVEVELGIKDTGSKDIKAYEKKIKQLEQSIANLNQQIGNIGSGGSNGLKGFDRVLDKSNKALEEMKKSVKNANGELSVMYDGNNKLLGVVTKIKDEMGNISTVKYKPTFDSSGIVDGFSKIQSIMKDLDGKDLNINKSKASDQLKELKQEVNITTKEYDNLKKQISEAPNNSALKKIIADIQELERSSKIDFKLFEGTDKVAREIRQIEEQLDRISKKSGSKVDMSAISSVKDQVNIVSSKDITSLQDVQKSLVDIANIKKQISSIRLDAGDTKQFENSMDKAKKYLRDMQNSTRDADTVVSKLYARLENVPMGDLVELEKVMKRISTSGEALKNRITISDGTKQAEANVRKLTAEVNKYYELNKKYIKKDAYRDMMAEIDKYANAPKKTVADIKDLNKAFKEVNGKVKEFGTETLKASRNSMTMVNSLRVAMERFPIWMASSTLFYGSIRSAKELVDVLIDIDTKLVSIEKVAGSGSIENTLDSATASAQSFGQSISQALDAYIEFSRQGYKGQDLETLSNAGLVAANVGEISAGSASEYVTSSLVQWKKETGEAMGIVDSWNEIANNYATTFEKIAEGQAKAGAVAKTVGMDFDQLNAVIGTVTATTKQSGSEIGNFVKAVIPRLTSKPAQDAMASLGVSLTDDDGNLRDVMEVYKEIAVAMQGINEAEKLAVTEGLAGKYHISRMQALLDDLASADSMYASMYESSKNSAGSAMRENEIYMQSLEAKINLVRVEFEKLAIAVGEAFLTDGMMAFLKGASKLLQSVTKVVETVGALPILFGVVGASVVLLSRRFRILGTEAMMVGGTFVKGAVASRSLAGGITSVTAATGMATLSVNALKGAVRGLLASTGIGIVLAGIGFGLEFLVGKLGEATEKTEELDVATKEIENSYKENAGEIHELAKQYAELEKKSDAGLLDAKGLEEYKNVANQIGTMMPSLVEGEDLYGNKILGTSEALQSRLGVMQEQLELENQMKAQEMEDKRKESIDSYNASLDEANEKIKVLISSVEIYESKNLRNAKDLGVSQDMVINLVDKEGNSAVKNVEDLLNLIDKVQVAQNKAEASGDNGAVEYYKQLNTVLRETYSQIAPHENNMKKATNNIKLTYIESVNAIINANDDMSESTKKSMSEMTTAMLNTLSGKELEQAKDAFSKIFSDTTMTSMTTNIVDSLNQMKNAGAESFKELSAEAEKAIKDLPKLLQSAGMNSKDAESVAKALSKSYDDIVDAQKRLEKQSKDTGIPMEVLQAQMEEQGDSASELVKEIKQLTNVYEELAGVSQKQVDHTDDLLFQYEMLTMQLGNMSDAELASLAKKKDLTNSEQALVGTYRDRQGVMQELNSFYPELLSKDGKAIALSSEKTHAIKVENEANKNLLKAYQLLRDGKLSSEQAMTVASQANTKARIANMREEIKALKASAQAMAIVANMSASMAFGDGVGAMMGLGVQNATAGMIDSANAQLSQLMGQLEGQNTQIANMVQNAEIENNSTKATKEGTKAKKDSAKATKENKYQTDLYKLSLEAVNYELEKQRKITSSFPKHSNEYRKSLQKEMDIMTKKTKMMQDQAKILEKNSKMTTAQVQAMNGGAPKTITTKNEGGGKTYTENRKLSGWNGRITSKYGTRADNHRGTDIAAKKGTRLESNVSGEVIKSGWSTNSNNGKAMHGSYGNMVVIQGDDGLKHIYAHLDKAVAKLGERVNVGQYIGNIGSTGNSSGPHLHYEQNTKNGKTVNSGKTVDAVRKGKFNVTTGGGGGGSSTYTTDGMTVGEAQQQIDQAKSDLIGIKGELLNQEEAMQELRLGMVESWLSFYDVKKGEYDKTLENSENRLKRMSTSSKNYRDELDKQTKSLIAKKKVNQEEIAYLQHAIKNAGLSADAIYEMTNRLHELGKANSEIDFALWDVDARKLESLSSWVDEITGKFTDDLSKNANLFANLELDLKGLNTASQEYGATLREINANLREKQLLNQKELTQLTTAIKSGKLYGEALEKARLRAEELQIQIKELTYTIQDSNFDILINIKTNSDEVVNDIDFEIAKANKQRSMYEQGSADYQKYTQRLISAYQGLAMQHEETRDRLTEEMKQQDLSAEKIKEIKRLLQEEHNAYLDATLAIKEHSKQLEESNKAQIEKVANDLIELYKEVIQVRKDQHMKAIDEEMERERKRHDERVKQLNDEMDLFRKNVQERLRLIEREEAQRSYDMKIDELEEERDKLQKQYDKMANVTSADDKKKRKDILDKINEIDKQIAEEQHQRNIELQKEGLNDLLEIKEDEIDGKLEEEDRHHDEVIKKIEREKEYWEKHYSDLLNDQRKFNQIREDLVNGHFDKIKAEFGEYITEMESYMPGFLDTLDGTMTAVGGTIQQNLIDNLREALNLMQEISDSKALDSNGIQDWLPPDITNIGGGNNTGKLNAGDLDIIVGKFLTDIVANQLTGDAKTRAHSSGGKYGQSGRANGGTVDKNISFDSAMAGLTQAERQQVIDYMNSQSGVNGGAYQKFFDQYTGTGAVGGTPSDPYNNASKYNIGASLGRGDTQVLMAKYMNDVLNQQTNDPALKGAMKNTADRIAKSGRDKGSTIPYNAGYNEILSVLNNAQRSQLRGFMSEFSSTISDPTLNEYLRRHIASLDTGGLTGKWSGLGVDGKGGKYAIMHPEERVLTKEENKRFFDSIQVQDKIMDQVTSMLTPMNPESMFSNINTGGGSYEFLFTGNIYANNKDQLEDIGRTITSYIKTTRG